MKLDHLFESDDLSYAERALARYTEDTGSIPTGENYDYLELKYPFDGGVLYRGLIFTNVEEFDDFMRQIEGGVLSTKRPSSWTRSKSTAKDFALNQKTYIPTAAIGNNYSKMQDAGDHMMGEGGGVIIKTIAPEGVGIDVAKTDFVKEDEVILPSGEYKIEVVQILRPYRVSHSTEDKAIGMAKEVLAFVKRGVGEETEVKKYATYLVKSWLDVLEPNYVDAIIEVLAPFGAERKSCLRYTYLDDKHSFIGQGVDLVGGIHIPVSPELYNASSISMQRKIKRFIEGQIKVVESEVDAIAKDLYKRLDSGDFKIHNISVQGFDTIALYDQKLDGMANKAVKPLRQFFTDAYHKLNDRSYTKNINPKDMGDFAKLIGSVITAMRSF